MSHAIEIEVVSKRYGQLQALDRVSFAVEPGEFFALLGPNGAGKTTLISALAGLARPDSGSIRVMGSDVVRDYRQARRALGVVPQELVFDPFLSVRETLRFQSGYFGLSRNDAWIDELLFKLGLADKADSNMRALSGGMKRRVMVAQALVHRPPVVVLDEPTAGVDVELRQSLWTFVQELNRAGTTIVLTTHYLEEAEALCGRIAMLKKGKLLALESKDKLLAHSARREVAFKLAGELPASLAPRKLRDEDGRAVLQLADLSELEGVLAELRQAGVDVRELNVVETDLESVFVKMMNGGAA
ncbi:ABC transporter ATP-binding protein [Chromobacterium phragmitis]|uniref:ABC transporter ATP-binding protein n=1 Tax=Chromobacterium phragmitis TaxID=2202141 RepID=A0A344UP04_9NEIS|nr:ABC transporter ATP-binding protein [Chromobacterium phragmitis]AXE32611.1 ABC transporter ATP-binding protein [Chromobacterium phragmitis]AXE37002.1 ABC transporter ATP-binding protein [Chromobacterium phragmitis]